MKKLLCALLSILLLASACGKDTKTAGEGGYAVYYATRDPGSDGNAVGSENHVLTGTGQPVEELVSLLLNAPESDDLVSPVPAGVTLDSWSLQEGVLKLVFSEGYDGLSGINLTIADYCVTLTLCQLEDVQSVTISVEGGLIPSRHYQQLRASDVLLSGSEDDEGLQGITLYFPKEDGLHLGIERRDLETDSDITRSEAAATALMEGPMGEDMISLMPKDAQLLSVSTENGICYVSFSEEFGQASVASSPEGALLLYSIVDTLCTLGGVEKVQLLIEGKAPSSFGGVPTLTALEPDYSLVEKD
jgi:germination protein M